MMSRAPIAIIIVITMMPRLLLLLRGLFVPPCSFTEIFNIGERTRNDERSDLGEPGTRDHDRSGSDRSELAQLGERDVRAVTHADVICMNHDSGLTSCQLDYPLLEPVHLEPVHLEP